MELPISPALVKQYEALLAAEEEARAAWKRVDKAKKKLVRIAKLGRKLQIEVPLNQTRCLRITDNFRSAMREKEDKVFAPAFAKRYEVKEVSLG